ncbi:hypothetical protein K402DRAFT_324377 [Aulographum hederae CBS 113979]|uniref:Exocyst complex component EXO84 n=1 Tax=Aulographum hederae CBS 113979 TaxID=1176131 RepID=A0A6G1HC34_9PEZI|nr:hypothetical protein K402DRAFT_324377 [Aulographum hederae CBS 113979]
MEEKEKSRGISLRKKRTVKQPKGSAPRKAPQISAPLPTGVQNSLTSLQGQPNPRQRDAQAGAVVPPEPPPVPREKPRDNDKTADLVKRRYSTRFTNFPSDLGSNGMPPLPPMPGMPQKYAVQAPQGRDGPTPRGGVGDRIRIDERALRDPTLRADDYVAKALKDATEEDIKNFQQDLKKIKNRTSTDLQHNVFQNRTQFIKISKEAEKLKGEMRTLRNLMADLTTTLSQTTSNTDTSTGAGNGAAPSGGRNRANRSSVANLEALYNSHLQALWKRVEGSQKFLPAIPGRHVVYESSRWLELNAATWKARRRVHIILLNDHFLLAADKKKSEAAGPRNPKDLPQTAQMVAQRCWPLQDVEIKDISMGKNVRGSEAVSLRVGAENFTFATGKEEGAERATLLGHYRKVGEELRRKLEAEMDGRNRSRESLAPSVSQEPVVATEVFDSSRCSVLIDVDGKQQNMRWVETQLDDLDIEIALQEFEAAVGRVETLKRLAKNMKGNEMAKDVIISKLDERCAKLKGLLIKFLKASSGWREATKRHVDFLARLGYEDQARIAYLESRDEILRKRTRQIVFLGDIHTHVFQLSLITFTLIRNTISVFQYCYPPSKMSSAVTWAKKHTDEFNEVLSRQMGALEPGSEKWMECVKVVKMHVAMLETVGLEFGEVVGQGVVGW